MFKLSPEQVKLHKALVEAVKDENTNVEQAVEDFDSEVSALFNSDVKPAIEKLNAAIEDLRNFCSEVENEAQESFNEKSETWQESESGQTYSEWIDCWNTGSSINDVEIDGPAELEFCADDVLSEMIDITDLEEKP